MINYQRVYPPNPVRKRLIRVKKDYDFKKTWYYKKSLRFDSRHTICYMAGIKMMMN